MNISELSRIAIYFSTGFFIPVLSRFLMKAYPCSMHSYVGDMLKHYINRKIVKNKHHINRFNILKNRYLFNCVIWGFVSICLCFTLRFLINGYISESYPLGLLFSFIFLLAFSANTDARFSLIPDIITFPMLMIGILIPVYTEKIGLNTALSISSLNSIYSAIGAYILCFSIALIFYFKKPFAFGGGDVKLLSAIAAFSGFEELGKILAISFAIMFVFCRAKKLKSAPLAPFVFAAFLIWIFWKIGLEISGP